MQLQQLGMLTFEATVMAAIVLGLFRARTVLGFTPLYIVLGGLQYLEATLNLRVEVLEGVWVYPASAVLFPSTLFSVLLVYVKEDAIEARKLVYGLVLANMAAAVISLLIGWHITMPGSVATNLRVADFFGGAYAAAVGTSLLFMDVLGVILIYEFVGRYVRGLFPTFLLTLLAIVSFDEVVFTAMVREHLSWGPLLSGLGAKWATALFYSFASWLYLVYAEPRTAVVGTGDVADVFQRLTYRQKYEQVRQRMVRDALTGLFNRGHFDETLPYALEHAQRKGDPLSLAIVDVDDFKTINDRLSHLEGDRVLQLIARTIVEQLRATDVPCRYGGDEFVILLPGAGAEAAEDFAERFREALRDRCERAKPPYPWGSVSTTVGVATYPSDPGVLTPEDLIRVADGRMYEGKRGRHARRGAAPADTISFVELQDNARLGREVSDEAR
jgi:diguanylate cyclase (GGDEF)-like protein